jgi:competence protein ComEA
VKTLLRAIVLGCVLWASPEIVRAEEKKVNINTATQQELMKLPDMNEARAKAIINYRTGNGELIQLEELKLIPQVAPIYDKIQGRLVLE